MTYGIRVVNSTLKTQIDSTDEMFGMAIKSAGTGSSIHDIDFVNDLVCIRMANLPNGGNKFVGASWNANKTSVSFHDGDFRETAQTLPLVNVDYIHLKQIRAIGFSYPESYGLQVRTPSGGLAFDSRALVYHLRPVIINMYPPSYFRPYSNNLGNLPYPDQILDNLTDYVSANGIYISAPGAAPVAPTFTMGFRFLNNVTDIEDGQQKTGVYFDSDSLLGGVPSMLNLSSIAIIRDYQ